MSLTWNDWTSVSDGATAPGALVTAVPWADDYALFISDPNGGIYAIKARPGFGWEAIPGLTSKPGAPVTALSSGTGFTLFTTDANGEVFTTTGAPYKKWAPWTSVSEGTSTPGATVTAVRWAADYALFISDPNGGIYAIKARPGFGWEAIPGLTSKPGAPVTALSSGTGFTLFTTDANGEVFTTTGTPYQGWAAWTSVSEGSTVPGATVTALQWADDYALFISDPDGVIYAIKARPGFGWEAIPGLTSKPGAPITALRWYKPPTSDPTFQRFLLFCADAEGAIHLTSGTPYQSWDPWSKLTGIASTSGGPVTAMALNAGGHFTLYAADSAGRIRETTSAAPPAKPDLAVAGVSAQTVDVTWTETNPTSVELDGFALEITNTNSGNQASGLSVHSPADRKFTFTNLTAGAKYKIWIYAFNDNGYSASATVYATTPTVAPKASLSAGVTNSPNDFSNYGLSIQGQGFGANETVEVAVTWKTGDGAAAVYPLGPLTANSLGFFQTWFTGNTPEGFCPISEPFGTPQPPQTFTVAATGVSSNRTASASAGPFTCPIGAPLARAGRIRHDGP
jgi:hypothetical protein